MFFLNLGTADPSIVKKIFGPENTAILYAIPALRTRTHSVVRQRCDRIHAHLIGSREGRRRSQSGRTARVNDDAAMLCFCRGSACQCSGRPRFSIGEIAHHSNCEPACAVRCTGRIPAGRDRAAHRIGEAKDACKAALVGAWRLPDIRRRFRLPVHVTEARTPGSYAWSESWIQATMPGRIGWSARSAGWAV
jgi:hypothetical protein